VVIPDFQGQGLEANAKDLMAVAKAMACVLKDPRGQGHPPGHISENSWLI